MFFVVYDIYLFLAPAPVPRLAPAGAGASAPTPVPVLGTSLVHTYNVDVCTTYSLLNVPNPWRV